MSRNRFKSWFSSLGVGVFSLFIQYFYLFLNISLSIFTFALFVYCSIKTNFLLILKLWPGKVKYFSAYRLVCSSSFLRQLRRKLKDPLLFLTYWILQRLYSIRWIIHLLLRMMLWNIMNSGFVCVLLNDFVSITCWQHCSWIR